MATALVVSAAALAAYTGAPAHAEGLGGISGWQPAPTECGTANVVPLLIGNYTTQTQTGSITIDGDLAEQVQVSAIPTTLGSPVCPGRDGTGIESGDGIDFQEDFTVAPGQVAAYAIELGGVDENLATASHTFSIGGLPSNVPNAQWYDFQLSLSGINESFKGLQPYYSMTGGTDSATNTQNGFNILSCSPSTLPSSSGSSSSVSITGPVLSPYSASTAYPPSYGWNQPMCLGWLPDGEYINDQASVITPQGQAPAVGTLDAVQYQGTIESVSLVADIPGPVTGVRVATPDSDTTTLLPNTPSTSGFWYQANGKLLIEGVPAFETTVIEVTGDGGATSLISIKTPAPGRNQPVDLPAGTVNASTTSSVPWASLTAEVGNATIGSDGDAVLDVTLNLELSGADFQTAFPNLPIGAGQIVLQSVTGPNGFAQQYNSVIAQGSNNIVGSSTGSFSDTVQLTVPRQAPEAQYSANLVVIPENGPLPTADQGVAGIPFSVSMTIDTTGL